MGRKKRTATATKGDIVVKMTENQKTTYVNKSPYEIDVPATITNGRFVVPVRLFQNLSVQLLAGLIQQKLLLLRGKYKMYNLEKLFKGVVSVKETDGLIEFKRFTDKQLETYKKIADVSYLRAKCPAGVKMEFLTEEKNLSFDFVTDGFCRDWLGFDVYENGILKKVDLREGACEKGTFSYKVTNEGKVKIEIYFMFSCNLKLKNLNFGDIEYLNEEKINYLALGDSITQGMLTKSASMSYPSILGRMYNLNVLNHGVGGYWFDKKSLDKDLPFCPDIITIAYGINDASVSFNNNKDENYVLEKAKEYIEEVVKIYPHSQIKIITPIWIKRENEEPLFKTHLDKIRNGLKEIGAKLGLDVIDGLKLVPHDEFYYGDTPSVHPNDAGFLNYALNISNIG